MIELETSLFAAPVPARADECAPTLISIPDRPANARRNIALSRRMRGCSPRSRRPRLAPLQVAEEEVQGPIKHLSDISRRDAVPQECLRTPKLVMRRSLDGELHEVVPGQGGRGCALRHRHPR